MEAQTPVMEEKVAQAIQAEGLQLEDREAVEL
jgi:hypothetical protein